MLRYGIHVLSAQVGERHKVLVLVGETSPQFLQLNGSWYQAKLDKLLVYKAVLYAQFDGCIHSGELQGSFPGLQPAKPVPSH